MVDFSRSYTDFRLAHASTANLVIHLLFIPQLVLALFGVLQPLSNYGILQFSPVGLDLVLFGILVLVYLRMNLVFGLATSLWIFGLLLSARLIYANALAGSFEHKVTRMFFAQIFIVVVTLTIGQKELEQQKQKSLVRHLLALPKDSIHVITLLGKHLGCSSEFYKEAEREIVARQGVLQSLNTGSEALPTELQ